MIRPGETYLYSFPLSGPLVLTDGAPGGKQDPNTVRLKRVPGRKPVPVEDFVVALLKFDPRWARAAAARNVLRRGYLRRRVREEGLDRVASEWRFEDFGLRLPPARKIPRERVKWHEVNNLLSERHLRVPAWRSPSRAGRGRRRGSRRGPGGPGGGPGAAGSAERGDDSKMDRLASDVRGRLNELVDSQAMARKLAPMQVRHR